MESSCLLDRQLWNRFKNGDQGALSLIYSENAKALYRYGLKFTGNREIIEDVIHDLFSDLMRNREKLGDTDNIKFYLYKAFRRKLIREMKFEARFTDEQVGELAFGTRYSIEQEIISKETKENISAKLLNAIEQLSPRQKEAIYLKYTKELEYDEISQILDMGVDASRNLIYRAIKSLKSTLAETCQEFLFLFFSKIPSTRHLLGKN